MDLPAQRRCGCKPVSLGILAIIPGLEVGVRFAMIERVGDHVKGECLRSRLDSAALFP